MTERTASTTPLFCGRGFKLRPKMAKGFTSSQQKLVLTLVSSSPPIILWGAHSFRTTKVLKIEAEIEADK